MLVEDIRLLQLLKSQQKRKIERKRKYRTIKIFITIMAKLLGFRYVHPRHMNQRDCGDEGQQIQNPVSQNQVYILAPCSNEKIDSFLLLLLDNPDLLVRKGLTSDATYRVLTLLMHAQTNQPGGSHTLC
jgi:hypothetical protein